MRGRCAFSKPEQPLWGGSRFSERASTLSTGEGPVRRSGSAPAALLAPHAASHKLSWGFRLQLKCLQQNSDLSALAVCATPIQEEDTDSWLSLFWVLAQRTHIQRSCRSWNVEPGGLRSIPHRTLVGPTSDNQTHEGRRCEFPRYREVGVIRLLADSWADRSTAQSVVVPPVLGSAATRHSKLDL